MKKISITIHIIFMNGEKINKSVSYKRKEEEKDVDYIAKAIKKFNPDDLPTTSISIFSENYFQNKNNIKVKNNH